MNKSSFRLAFMAVLASSLSGCASPMRMFSKKPQPFDEYVAQRKSEQARIAANHSTAGGPAEVSELLHQGHAAFQQGNLPEAQSKYFAVVQRQPNHPVANHRLGVISDRQQDFLSAQRYYFAALHASPNDPNLLNDIGYSFLLQSRFQEAESYLQGALQKNPKQSNAINNLGLLYAKQGQPERALAMFRMTNSEAEARAKLTRLLPSGLNTASPAGTMIANQGWPPQNPASMNAAPYSPYQNDVAPTNPAFDGQVGPGYGNPNGNSPGGFSQPQMPPPNLANGGWTTPEQVPPINSSNIAQAAASDPNIPEATRRLKEQMEIIRLKAVAERQNKDNADRQRQEMLKQQLRDEELGRANIVNPVYSQTNGANRWSGSPNSVPANPNAPIVIGPPPKSNVPNSTSWRSTLDGQRTTNTSPETMSNGNFGSIPNYVPNPIPDSNPNRLRESLPAINGTPSPLDAMPTYPPAGSIPPITPSFNGADFGSANPPPSNSAWPNGLPPGMSDEAARAASRMGMNAGSSNPFPITPGPSSGSTSLPNGLHAPNTFNNFGTPNGSYPTMPGNSPSNPNSQNTGSQLGEPPAGTFGFNNVSPSANSQNQFMQTPIHAALQDQLPPSEQFQTPGQFGYLPSRMTQTQPASFGTNRSLGGNVSRQFGMQNVSTTESNPPMNSTERANTRSAAADRFGGDERWDNGSVPNTQSVQTSTPSMQGHLSTQVGDNSLLEYERMIQLHNVEANRIRQQIDEQRQLPASENFRRSRSQSQTAVSTGPGPRQ